MSSDPLLRLDEVSKAYPAAGRPLRRLWEQLRGRPVQTSALQTVLAPISLQLEAGQSLGIVGLNGAGKSTLLQLAAGTLTPSGGQVHMQGRLAALLELGSGFNPEASGRENIHLYSATLGLTRQQVDARIEDIIVFSGLADAIDAPVKTYSSGMQVRLAFTVATSVDPDILIVDEALSVGDGVFAKRSFDRVMQLRERGTAFLLCSHALFHVDLFCANTLWLHQGQVRAYGPTAEVLPRYQEFIDDLGRQSVETVSAVPLSEKNPHQLPTAAHPDLIRLRCVKVALDGIEGRDLHGIAHYSDLSVDIELKVSVEEPEPLAAVVISSDSGKIIGSSFSPPGAIQASNAQGHARICFELPRLPLNRGRYRVGVYLLCARGRYVYEWMDPYAHLNLDHEGPHHGPWLIPGHWRSVTEHAERLSSDTASL